MHLRIRGYLTGWTGYGQIAEWLGRGLEARGHTIEFEDYGADLRWLPQQDFVRNRITGTAYDGWVVHCATPNHPFDAGNPTIVFTMWETDGLPPQSVTYLNRARAVVVPSKFNLRSFRDNGIFTSLYQCPLGIDSREGYVHAGMPQGPITFGMAARLAGGGGTRKGINEGIWAFIDAFPTEDVRLRVKVCPDCVRYIDTPTDPRVEIDTRVLRPVEMAAWYRTIHCLFVPSRCEGWGLHTHQAMAMGRPIVACDYGGTAELFARGAGWPIEYDVMPANGFYTGVGNWAVPRHDAMVVALRHAAANRLELMYRGQKAASHAGSLTWNGTARTFERILEEIGALEPVGV